MIIFAQIETERELTTERLAHILERHPELQDFLMNCN